VVRPGLSSDDGYGGAGQPRHEAGGSGQLLFGRNAVLEALRAGRAIRRVMVAESAHGEAIDRLADAARARGVQIDAVDRQRLDEIGRGVNHQGVVARVAPFRYATVEEIVEAMHRSASPPLVLVLDTLQDPQNFGSLLRTAAAVGAHGAIIPEHRAVEVTPAVARVSAGATEHLPIARVGNLVRALAILKEAGLWVVGLDARAETPHVEADLSGPLAIVVGGEDRGLRPLVRRSCDFLVRLPMPGPVESLNAAVAGSIILYEVLRRRESASPAPADEP
jgi:23S rRNA (guanosine2251-2'-O)-methyltransferase